MRLIKNKIFNNDASLWFIEKLPGAPPPPVHAINRGIGIEGLGTMLAGLWGEHVRRERRHDRQWAIIHFNRERIYDVTASSDET